MRHVHEAALGGLDGLGGDGDQNFSNVPTRLVDDVSRLVDNVPRLVDKVPRLVDNVSRLVDGNNSSVSSILHHPDGN